MNCTDLTAARIDGAATAAPFTFPTTPAERDTLMRLALGRIFRLGARPTQPGDVEEYERCRALILAIAPEGADRPDYRPCYVRDRLSGAAVDP